MWNLFPLQSSKFPFEYLLLPPRSALKAVSLWLMSWAAQQPSCFPTHWQQTLAPVVEYKWPTSAPSIFRASSFSRWVFTHCLADSNFHGHNPPVYMNQHLLWDLGEQALWHFISTFGSSLITKPAYPAWPTSNYSFNKRVQLSNSLK